MSRWACDGSRRWMMPTRGRLAAPPALRATMSAPPQKWSPAPVSRIARTASSRPAASTASMRPATIVVVEGVALVGPVERAAAGRPSCRRSTVEAVGIDASRSLTRRRTGRRWRRARAAGRWRRRAGRAGAPGRARGSGSRIVAWPGVVTSPRWFSATRSRSTAGRSPSARYLRVDRAPQPLGVAHVVEQAELAVELPQPGVVAHPVGAQVDEPGLAHAAVVERRRVARPAGELGVPVDPLHARRGR